MRQATTSSESKDAIIAQSSPRRPELVLSVKDYLQYNSDSNNDTTNGDSAPAKIQLVLASASPRRREILDMMGLKGQYLVIPSPLNETQIQIKLCQNDQVDPILYTRTLAEQKAYAVAYDLLSRHSISSEPSRKAETTRLILGSDTVVAITDDITNVTTLLEKPMDTNDAIRMLQQLQNRSHVVYTGVAVVRYTPPLPQIQETLIDDAVHNVNDGYYQDNLSSSIQLVHSFVETATVFVSAMNEIDIESYVATQEPMDKAGAYGIQGIGGQMVAKIDGDFFTVSNVCMYISFLLETSFVCTFIGIISLSDGRIAVLLFVLRWFFFSR